MKYPTFKKILLAISLTLALIGLGLAVFKRSESITEKVQASAQPRSTTAKIKKPKVKLLARITTCQKLKVTIPLEAGFITQSDDLRVARGYVENIGDLPVQFVQVQVVWKDKEGKIIDYDNIFALTKDTLYPGEKVVFKTSKQNYKIERCGSKILDWWVVDSKRTRT